MKLAIMTAGLQAGGTERAVTHLANGWAEDGHEVHIMTWGNRQESPHFPLHPSIGTVPLGLFSSGFSLGAPLRIWRRLQRIRRALLDIAPDAALAFGDRSGCMLTFAALGTGFPVLVSERTNPREFAALNGPLWTWLIRRGYRLAARLIAQTQGAADCLAPYLRRPAVVIPNLVLPPVTPSSRPAPVPRPYLLSVGRLSPEKGQDLLIDAFAKVTGRFPDWRLALVGDGVARTAWETRISDANLQNRVVLPGTRTDVDTWYADADLFVLPSRFEGFPNALCEAMAHGRAVIATDCEFGPAEIVRDGVDGVIVPTDDVAALAEAMERLMADPALRERLGHAARAITERYGPARVRELWDTAIRDAIGRAAYSTTSPERSS